MAAYSLVTDLLIDDLPTSAGINKQKYVDDAADEMDIQIGSRYVLPLDVSSLSRPSQLVLKRINNYLASGRLLLRLALSKEDKKLHELAASWITEAQTALGAIRDGSVDLLTTAGGPAAELTDAAKSASSGPSIYNEDASSNVGDFYDYFKPSDIPLVINPAVFYTEIYTG